eukprot:scaffold6536_cov83-Skeletonema_dohrnii-CCMP3373.AAC.3
MMRWANGSRRNQVRLIGLAKPPRFLPGNNARPLPVALNRCHPQRLSEPTTSNPSSTVAQRAPLRSVKGVVEMEVLDCRSSGGW